MEAKQPHYPQDDGPLCCCEYLDRHGHRAHILGLCCACDEIDQFANQVLSGEKPQQDLFDEIISTIDDRMRLPLPGGAWHVGLPGLCPWLLLPPLLLFGAFSARCLLLASCMLLPLLFWWHRRSVRLRKRSSFLLSWMLCSLASEALIYMLALKPVQPQSATLAFTAPLMLTMLFFALLKLSDPSSCVGVADLEGARARGVTCPVTATHVPRYDHYCTWVDEPIGAANHRAFLGFVLSMIATCFVGAAQLGTAAYAAGWSVGEAWRSNRSSLLVSCAAYGFAAGGLVLALLVHQVALILSGRTAYEARGRRGGQPAPSEGQCAAAPGAGNGAVATFLAQTRPFTSLRARRALE